MARWIDTRSTDGDLLYSVRPCGKYSVWPDAGQWLAKYHASGNAVFDPGVIIGRASGASAAQILCRDHIVQQQQAAVAAGDSE